MVLATIARALRRPASAAALRRGASNGLRSLSTAPPPPPQQPPVGNQNTQSVVEIRSPQEFEELCVKASATPPPVGGPVILDFYADWCEPCKQLTPKLARLVEAAGGAVRLAKINTDALPELAQALQVVSLPTVMLLHGGKLVNQFKGAVPDAELKQFVDKAVELAGGAGGGLKALERAAALLQADDVPGATQAYADLLALPEFAASASAGLALCALKDDNLAMAQTLIAELHKNHPGDVETKADVRKAIATVNFAADAADAGELRDPGELRTLLEASPRDHQLRYELAQTLLAGGEQGEAIDELLLIVRRDKHWEDGQARTLLLKLFDSLGNDHDLTKTGRRRLANYLLL